MSIVKLAPDEKLLLLVKTVAVVPGQYGESVRFIGESATDKECSFNMSPDNADRQFKRLGLTAETVIGRTVEFSAKKDGARKLIDMKLPAGSPLAVAASPSAAPVMSAPATLANRISDLQAAKDAGEQQRAEVIAGIRQGTAALADPELAKAARRADFDSLVKCYRKCLREAHVIAQDEMKDVGTTDVGVATIAGSLFNAVLDRWLST